MVETTFTTIPEGIDSPSAPVTVVTGSDRPAGAVVATLLTQRGHDVIGLGSTGHSCHHRPVSEDVGDPPPAAPASIIPLLTRMVTENHAGLVVPTLRHELPAIAAARTLIEATGAKVLVAGAGPVAVISDRLFATAHLRSRGVPVPRFVFPGDVESPHDALAGFDGAIVAVPRSTACTCRPMLITTATDQAWDRLDDSWMLREALPGQRFRALVHRPPQGRDGRIVRVVHEPSGGAVDGRRALPGTARPIRAPLVERLALSAVRAAGLTGPASIEVHLDRDGNPMVTDLDATFGQHLRLAPEVLDASLSILQAAPVQVR